MDITNHNNEATLIADSLSGNKEAFETLFNNYKEMVKSLFIKYRCDDFDSKDLVQETFIKAFLNLSRYDSKYSFGGWIRTIARNTFIDYSRRKQVKNNIIRMDTSLMSESDGGNNPEEVIIINERRVYVENEINSLSDNYRIIIELRYFMGLSYEQIADQLQIPIGTVKTRLHRAKKILNLIAYNTQ